MPTAMSKHDDEWSIQTPPRMFSPKRQKIDTETVLKFTMKKDENQPSHVLHVMLLQIIASITEGEVKILNKRGEVLKESALPTLMNEAVHKNHFDAQVKFRGSKDKRTVTSILAHRFRGVTNDGILKKDKKVMDFLKTHDIQMTTHHWKEEDWNTTLIGFFTNIFPKNIPLEHANKVVNQMTSGQAKKNKMPMYRVKVIPMQYKSPTGSIRTRVFALEVKTTEVKMAMEFVKNNMDPGTLVPFHMRTANENAYEKAIRCVQDKNENMWAIMINYVSEGAFFKLEEKIKLSTGSEHVIYMEKANKIKIMVHKNKFESVRLELKEDLLIWASDLDPEDTREYDTNPEIAHIYKDDFSDSSGSFMSRSIASLMSIEIVEVENKHPEEETTTNTTPSELSFKSQNVTDTKNPTDMDKLQQQVEKYRDEMAEYAIKLEKLTKIMEQILTRTEDTTDSSNKSQPKEGRHREPEE